MRYDDLSQAAPEATTVARADVDSLPPGASGPATGNTISGSGTITGLAGADSVGDPPAHIVGVQGAGGAVAGGNGEFVVKGAYGTLTIEADGSYSYVRNAGAPDGVDDVFKYTLADSNGHQSSSTLTIELGVQTPSAAATAALEGVPGVISLPAGVDVSDIHVVGRDLVIDLPDGTHMTIPGGAVFVPQLVIGDVELPPSNLAALLIDSEPKPAAGPPQSSGGNFAVDVPPLDPGVPLGDLLPPTELAFQPPEFQPVNGIINHQPTILIETPDNPAGVVNATESVFEKGLPVRSSESAGSGEIADGNGFNNSDTSESNTGTIVYTAQDGLDSITVNGVAITAVGQVIHGQFGTMTITSIANGAIGYSYTLLDNTSGDNTADNFTVVVTETDGDSATGSLTVHIVDDVPTAHNDIDALTGSDTSTDGNVMTGAGTTSASSGADVVGADNATVTGVHAGTSGGFTSVPQDGAGVTIHGTLGDLVLHDDGTYTYTRTDAHAGGSDVFTYQLTDGDGDVSTATLTITVPQINQAPEVAGADVNVSEEGLVGGNPDSVGTPDTTNLASNSGTVFISDPDGDATTAALGVPSGSFTSGGVPVTWAVSDGGHTLTGTAGTQTVITVTIDNSGHFTVALSAPFDDPTINVEDSIGFAVPVSVSDGIATVSTAINVTVEDDGPTVSGVTAGAGVTVDETTAGSLAGYPISSTSATAAITATTSSGADAPASTAYGLTITGGSGTSSGLATSIGDHPITLVQVDGDTIEGRYTDGSGTHTAFSIDIDSAGKVTVTLDVPLEHLVDGGTPADYNDALNLSGLVNATITVTDADGDTASGSAAIGGNITFLDDGPSIDVAAGADAGILLTTHDSATIGAASDTATSTADFGGVFSIASSSGGGDGAAAAPVLAFALGAVDGTNSGLTQTGNVIYLYQLANGSVVGSTASTEGGVTSGNTVFSVTVNGSGQVTLTQFSEIDHPIGSDPTPTGAPFADQLVHLADGAITLTASATITDNDGDTATDSQTIGIGANLQFADDGPTAHNDTDATGAIGTTATGNLITGVDHAGGDANTTDGVADSVGADTPGHISAVASVNVPGNLDTDPSANFTINGQYGTLVLNANGDYTYTRSGGPGGGVDTFTYTLQDADGDTSTATLTITLGDSAPVATTAAATVDDDGLTGGVAGGTGDINANTGDLDGPASSEASFTGILGSSATGDGPTTFLFLGSLAGTTTTVGQEQVTYSLSSPVSGGFETLTATVSSGARTGTVLFTVNITDPSTGQYTVTLVHNVLQAAGGNENNATAVIDYQMQDSDGDTSATAGHLTITFNDDTPVAAIATTGQSISVDETPGLQGDANDVAGPIAAFAGVTNVGVDPNMAAQYATNANAIVTAAGSAVGADSPGTTVLSLNVSSSGVDSGLNTTDGHDILLYNEGGIIVGRVSGGTDAGKAAFAVSIDSTGHLSMVEYLSIQHPNTGSADESVSINNGAILAVVTVNDADGDSATQSVGVGSLISFQDDGPVLGTVQDQQASNDPTQAPAVGTLHFTPGADGAGSTMTITADTTGITSGGHSLLTVQSGNVLTAYQDTNNDGIHQVGESTVVFTLTVNPSAGTSGQYAFDLVTPLDPTVTDTPIGGSSAFGAGPTGFQVLDSATSAHLSVLSGYNTTASFDEATWLSTGNLTSSMIADAGINGSTSGWGVDNNIFSGTTELMVFDFGSGTLLDPDGAGGINPSSSGASLPNISTATFDFIQYTTADDITYVVHLVDASGNPLGIASGHIPTTNLDSSGPNWTYTAPAGEYIGDIQLLTSGAGPGKVDLVSVGVQSSSLNQTIDFSLQLTDGDGDPTASGAFSVHVSDGLTPFAPAAPVVLDLNGDGVHFLAAADGVTYDYGDGAVATAWASPQDGILVHDANGNGTVDGASEFVFGGNGVSDLQALSAYDTNGDGKLTSADTAFASFGVWQDANSNGVVDSGEYQTLAARGITAISLTTDGVTYETANGDVTVVGTGSYTNADGTTGALADAIFATAAKVANDDLRTSTALSSNGLLFGAVAAAGLMSAESVAAQGHENHSPLATGLDTAIETVSANLTQVSANDDGHVQSITGETKVALSEVQQPQDSSHQLNDTQSVSLDSSDHGPANAPTALPQGTDMPAHADSAPGQAVAAMAVAMPSAEQIAALASGTGSKGVAGETNSQVDGAAHNQVVGRVLADSLAGGGSGHQSAIEAVLNSLPSHDGAHSAIEALASHGAANVPVWDAVGMASFATAHPVFSMEAMMLHPDAAPAAHS